MPDSIEKTKEMLIAAKAATEEARRKLQQTEDQLDQIDLIHLDFEGSFPRTKAVLDEMAANNEQMKKYREGMRALVCMVDEMDKGMKTIERLERIIEAKLKTAYYLDKKGEYEQAIKTAEDMAALAASYDFGETLGIQRVAAEAAEWTKAGVRTHQAEARVAKLELPFEEENGLEDYVNFVHGLPLGIHTQAHIDAYEDIIIGFRLMERYVKAKAVEENYDELRATIDLLDEVQEKEASFSKLTKRRYQFLRVYSTDVFNRLSADAFDAKRDYDLALEFFLLRDRFEKDAIAHVDYREAVDEKDFKLRFLKVEAVRQPAEDYAIAVDAYARSISKPDEFEMDVLANYLAMDNLDEDKLNLMYSAIGRMSFELTICLLGTALPKGVDAARQERLIEFAENKKQKLFALEPYAKFLIVCRDSVDESLQERMQVIVDDILRSPKAHKVCVKSTSPDVHALYGETGDAVRAPWGKPMPSDTRVKSWDFLAKGFFFGFGIVFPLAVLAIGEGLMYWLLKDNPLCPYLLLAPLVVMLLIGHLAITGRHGRDERGSAVYRRTLTISAIVKAILGLLYFALPGTFGLFQPFGYTLIIIAAVEGLWALFLLNDKKRAAAIATFVPLLLIEGASLVFLILGLMNGTI